MFLIGLATLVVSIVAILVQRSIGETQRRNAEREIQLKQENASFEERVEGDRLAAAAIPFLGCQDSVPRAAALQLVGPKHAQSFAAIIAQRCNLAPRARLELKQIQEQSDVRQQENKFNERLSNAREFKRNGLDGPASRLFNEASQLVPKSYDSRVNKDELVKAKKAFSQGDFSEAADRFAAAFSALPNSE